MHRSLAVALLLGSALATAGPDTAQLEEEAAALAHQFVARLKPQLQQAMKEGGPTRAIEVCASAAPRLADGLSADSGWRVKRVSLKARNASRATPDDWERGILQEFDRLQAAGEPAQSLHVGELVGDSYRYMQAQGTAGLCLTCHGQDLSQPVAETLRKYYPDDMATGYQAGQVRGAVSLSKQLGATSRSSL